MSGWQKNESHTWTAGTVTRPAAPRFVCLEHKPRTNPWPWLWALSDTCIFCRLLSLLRNVRIPWGQKAPALETIRPDPHASLSMAAGRADTNAVSERSGYFINISDLQAMNDTRFAIVLPTLDGVSLNKVESIASHKIIKWHYCLKHIRPIWLGHFTEHFS